MEQATSTVNKEFVFESAQSAGLDPELDLLNYVNCHSIVKLCAAIADDGGDSQQIIAGVADHIEGMAKEDREFAGLVADQCVRIVGNRSGKEAAAAIRTSFEFLVVLADADELERQIWSFENPRAYTIALTCTEQTPYADWLAALDRGTDALAAEFGDNNAVVAAFDDAYDFDGEPNSPEARQRWEHALAKAKASTAEGLPDGAVTKFEVLIHYTF